MIIDELHDTNKILNRLCNHIEQEKNRSIFPGNNGLTILGLTGTLMASRYSYYLYGLLKGHKNITVDNLCVSIDANSDEIPLNKIVRLKDINLPLYYDKKYPRTIDSPLCITVNNPNYNPGMYCACRTGYRTIDTKLAGLINSSFMSLNEMKTISHKIDLNIETLEINELYFMRSKETGNNYISNDPETLKKDYLAHEAPSKNYLYLSLVSIGIFALVLIY